MFVAQEIRHNLTFKKLFKVDIHIVCLILILLLLLLNAFAIS